MTKDVVRPAFIKELAAMEAWQRDIEYSRVFGKVNEGGRKSSAVGQRDHETYSCGSDVMRCQVV